MSCIQILRDYKLISFYTTYLWSLFEREQELRIFGKWDEIVSAAACSHAWHPLNKQIKGLLQADKDILSHVSMITRNNLQMFLK